MSKFHELKFSISRPWSCIWHIHSNEHPWDIGARLLDYIKADDEQFQTDMVVVFTMMNMDLTGLLYHMECPNSCAYKVALYGRCQLHLFYSLVYTLGSVWTSLEPKCQTGSDEIMIKSDLHFAYLNGEVIGLLLDKPSIRKMNERT